MKIVINIKDNNDWLKPVGHFRTPLLDIGYDITETEQTIYFNNEEEVIELYDRYKEDITWDRFGLQDEEDIYKYMITIEDFLESEYIYILLGCLEGEGHEVLYS